MSESRQSIPQAFPAFIAREEADGNVKAAAGTWQEKDLPPQGVDIQVEYSCLNYKDALSAIGNKGVSPNYPHIPGIDASGIRMDSGEKVVITGFDLGMGSPGGLAAYARVPEAWLIPLPSSLDSYRAMTYGTAGVTAGLCVQALLDRGVKPDHGPVLVSGATGGVGSIAVSILAGMGFEVHGVTGKDDKHAWLKSIGAAQVIPRDEFLVKKDRPLMRPEYIGAVDTVGSSMLHRILRSLKFSGTVAACGMVGGTELETNIFPFILRDVALIGIASADSSRERKKAIWSKLADEWSVDWLQEDAKLIRLDELPSAVEQILAGGVSGRIVVNPGE
ncbi:YhdH/YhfP family quinone oxidoreductase [Salinispira pacifica]|uniref:Alcohol dehydrogenase n=1 Tax=Salinispira pacifica TaxID=1307761 RepID=V5WIR5_9SPIO|nr:YhdH/YhfP family quinone oxidoreductase [Salinispira pacifica]AHC15732.1 Alcohol dehydrogenase [Salinispira pacifica]